MPEIIDVHEAKTHLSRLLDRAHAGEEIVLSKAGKPCVRLVPLKPSGKREFGFLEGNLDDSSTHCRTKNYVLGRAIEGPARYTRFPVGGDTTGPAVAERARAIHANAR